MASEEDPDDRRKRLKAMREAAADGESRGARHAHLALFFLNLPHHDVFFDFSNPAPAPQFQPQ
jgi:hypothetical protein